MATGDCSADGYEWSDWYNNDDAGDSGDWELRSDDMCANPTAVKVHNINNSSSTDFR